MCQPETHDQRPHQPGGRARRTGVHRGATALPRQRHWLGQRPPGTALSGASSSPMAHLYGGDTVMNADLHRPRLKRRPPQPHRNRQRHQHRHQHQRRHRDQRRGPGPMPVVRRQGIQQSLHLVGRPGVRHIHAGRIHLTQLCQKSRLSSISPRVDPALEHQKWQTLSQTLPSTFKPPTQRSPFQPH